MAESPSLHPPAERLEDFALGKLIDAEAAQIADHLAACDPCQKAVAAVPDDSVLALVRSAPPSSVSGTAEALFSGAASDSWVPPELIDHPRYRLLEWLGAGGMSVVFKAEHRLMQRTVAIKVISKKLTTNANAVERFQREVKAAAKLSHPNIVTAYDAERAGDLHLLVMEYVEGKNLARLVEENGRLPVDEACDYARQVALGLQHAFELGMVHRDIKPSNLMVTGKGGVKILDFGLAGFVNGDNEPQTEFGATLGTPSYMAPEQARDARSSDIRADIYSLGCTLYFLLAGRSPFPHGTTQQKIAAHREDTPRSISALRADLPTGLAQVLQKMLAKEAVQRFQTPTEVVQALSSYVTKKRPGSRRKVLVGLVGVLVLGLSGPIVFKAAVLDHRASGSGEPAKVGLPTTDQGLQTKPKVGQKPEPQKVERKPEPKPAKNSVENFSIGKAALELTSTVVDDRHVKFVYRVRNFGTDFAPITAWIEKHGDVLRRKIMEFGLGMGTWDQTSTTWPPRLENGVATFEVVLTRRNESK